MHYVSLARAESSYEAEYETPKPSPQLFSFFGIRDARDFSERVVLAGLRRRQFFFASADCDDFRFTEVGRVRTIRYGYLVEHKCYVVRSFGHTE